MSEEIVVYSPTAREGEVIDPQGSIWTEDMGYPYRAASIHLEQKSPDGGVWFEATVKWDGCIDFTRYFNSPRDARSPEDDDETTNYLHICDVDGMIAMLQEIKRRAQAHFPSDWPESFTTRSDLDETP